MNKRDSSAGVPSVREAALYFDDCARRLYQLGALFEAVSCMSAEFTTARGLADVGVRLSEEWASSMEAQRERYRSEVPHA
ncbi:hypothetical protein LMG27952_01745 [Paraburkholderia hiiakae]|uniref:Uncharacterized protein n=1 Tax=Paraburkholderia hiiakae TaxID=1081782 RepID=A0ABM8NGW0_9BURK|nr:hypothetical protein [Paraburkholderia hiiakae]CAD6524629.1 hypothetical protein LMG27952_01745 [Paraburkholderia hiiakae]